VCVDGTLEGVWAEEVNRRGVGERCSSTQLSNPLSLLFPRGLAVTKGCERRNFTFCFSAVYQREAFDSSFWPHPLN
jgi:hypothetical protein